MKRKILEILFTCFFIVTFGVVSMSYAAEELRIGVSSSLSGPAVGWGQPCWRTIDTQAEMYNKAGGVKIGGKNYIIKIVTVDDKYLAESGAQAFTKLIYQEKVDYILMGGPSTLVALAGGPLCQKNEVVCLLDGTSGPGLQDNWEWVFRPCLTDFSRGTAIVLWLAKNKKEIKTVAYACPDTEGGHASNDIFQENIKKHTDWKVVEGGFYQAASKEYYPLLSKILRHKPDLIYTDTATTGDLGLLIKQARELGYNGAFLQAAVVDAKALAGISGTEACDNIYNPGVPFDVNPQVKALVEAYEAKYGERNGLTLWSLDYLPVLIQAMQVAGTTDKYKVRDVLESATKPGILNSMIGPGARFYTEKYLNKKYSRQWLSPVGITRIDKGKSTLIEIIAPDEMLKVLK
ncbi:MAG: ABC transporter substrate-binding protein [Pseudomonadota bacterium]